MFKNLVFSLLIGTSVCSGNDETKNSVVGCKESEANKFVNLGFKEQSLNKTTQAIEAYEKSIQLDQACVDAYYEIGWSYWKLGEWKKVVTFWKKALQLKPNHEKIPKYLPAAEENLKIVESGAKTNQFRKNTDLFSQTLPESSPVKLTLVRRWQSYNKTPDNINDIYDEDISSPKSVSFSSDNSLVAVNSLEGLKTIFFDSDGSKKLDSFFHKFSTADVLKSKILSPFFNYPIDRKVKSGYLGKPVESIFTHNNKYLWVTHYRKSYDEKGRHTSTLAIIDSHTKKLVRIIGTGPISKYIEGSPDGKWVAVSNWGDNTVGIYNIESSDPMKFSYFQHLIIEKKHSLKKLGANRDKDCGFCVRGLAFSPDGQFLYVTRMKGGGITLFKWDSQSNQFKHYGTLMNLVPGPRDIHFTKDGKSLFVGCNATGTLVKFEHADFVSFFSKSIGVKLEISKEFQKKSQFVGLGLRSFKLHPKLNYVFLTSNNGSEIIIAKTEDLTILGRVPVDSFPVGLGISPDGKYLWVTSQGKESLGGNSVGVFLITEYLSNTIQGK